VLGAGRSASVPKDEADRHARGRMRQAVFWKAEVCCQFLQSDSAVLNNLASSTHQKATLEAGEGEPRGLWRTLVGRYALLQLLRQAAHLRRRNVAWRQRTQSAVTCDVHAT